MPVVSADAAPRLCRAGGGAEHGHPAAARPAGQLLRCTGAAAHRVRGALAGGVFSRAGQLRPAVCLHRCRRAGAFVPQPQPRRTIFAGGELRPRPPWTDRLSHRPAVCRSAAVSASAGLSGWHRSRRCRAGKGIGRRAFRHRGAQQPCLRRHSAGYAAHRRDAQTFASRQRGAGCAADHLPSGAAGGGSGGVHHYAKRLHSGAGYRHGGGARQRQCAGLRPGASC